MKISDTIRERIQQAGGNFYANHNISEHLQPGEMELLTKEVAEQFAGVLNSLVIDTQNDHNTQDTANRVAKMFVQEIFGGRYLPAPKITSFPNVTEYDELYVTGPITIRSMCAHHMMPIRGRAYIGVFPGRNVIGLSKFNRIVHWIASRPQIQEEMTTEIAKALMEFAKTEHIAVIVKAEHHCMTHRGVREHENEMVTAIMNGKFQTEPSLKKEFYDVLKLNV